MQQLEPSLFDTLPHEIQKKMQAKLPLGSVVDPNFFFRIRILY
jgi:hypothetical protein